MKSKLAQLLLIVVFTPLSLELVITGQSISLRDTDDSRAFNHPTTIKAKTKDGIWIIPDRNDPKYSDDGYINKLGYYIVPNTNNVNYCLLSVRDPQGNWIVPNLNDPGFSINGYKDINGH